jgi:hypothetical protein
MMAYLTLYNVFTQLLCVPEPKFLHRTTGMCGMIIMIPGKSQAFLSSSAITISFFTCEWPEPVNYRQGFPAIVH